MKSFTPGPWEVWTFDECETNIAVGPQAGGIAVAQIVTANGHGLTTEKTISTGNANACLIATAPELLNALEELINKCNERGFHPVALLHAQYIVNKAKGE